MATKPRPSDRFRACAAFTLGDTELLNRPHITFVASQGFYVSELRPRKIWAKESLGGSRGARLSDTRVRPPRSVIVQCDLFAVVLLERGGYALDDAAPQFQILRYVGILMAFVHLCSNHELDAVVPHHAL